MAFVLIKKSGRVIRPSPGSAGRSAAFSLLHPADAGASAEGVPNAYRHSSIVFTLAVVFLLVMPFAVGFEWHGRINIDVGDIVYLPMLVMLATLAMRAHDGRPTFWQEMPRRRIWILYGIFATVAYAQWSYHAGYLGGGSLYQFYRYAWKPMLMYPVVFYMAARPRGIQLVILAVILTTDLHAVTAIQQGRAGLDVRGVMSLFHKNMLGGSFLVPLFLAICESMHNPSRIVRYATGCSAVLIAAALWYAVSRGAVVGAVAGALVYMLASPRGWRLAVSLVAVAALVLMIRPDFGSTSGIMQRFTDIENGTEADNFAWRARERWPHFVEIVSEHPLLGVGQAVDLTLGTDTNTPHNGYLALMVQSGIPAAVCYVLMLASVVVGAARLTRDRQSARVRGWGAAALAGVVAFCVHNLVETTFESGPAGYSIWIACGLVMALTVRRRQRAAAVAVAAVA